MKDEMCWKFCKRVESAFASRAYSWCFDIWHVRQKILHKSYVHHENGFSKFQICRFDTFVWKTEDIDKNPKQFIEP